MPPGTSHLFRKHIHVASTVNLNPGQTPSPARTIPCLQVLLTMTPGINNFFQMPEGMDGVGWARSIGGMFIIYIIVEIEKVGDGWRGDDGVDWGWCGLGPGP